MIGFMIAQGLSPKVAKLVGFVIVPLLIIGAFYLLLDAYGDSRFREGRAKEAAAWQKAHDELLQKAATSGAAADRDALAREIEFTAAVEEEKDRIDDAIENGTSPLDVLFPTGVQ